MARELGVPLHEVVHGGPRVFRHLLCTLDTLRILRSARPGVVFSSNPSIVLTILLLALRPILGYRFVSDAHFGGVVAMGAPSLQRVLDAANRRADLVIVTNEGHADQIEGIGGKPFVFPDPLPELPDSVPRPAVLNGTGPSVLFICSFDKDEPVNDVFAAAELLVDEGFRFFVSGRYSRVGLKPETVKHVTLLGYVDLEVYLGLLSHADIILDLTTLENCLVCGAYEAMAATRPAVLSRTASITALFSAGTVFTTHEPAAIANAVREAYARREELRSAIPGWLAQHNESTKARAQELSELLDLPERQTVST